MSEEAQDTWFEAASKALAGFSAADLRIGARRAMQEADHPSKVVPAIVRAIGAEKASRYQPHEPSIVPPPALPAPGKERCTKDELDAICRQHQVGRYAKADDVGARRSDRLDLDPARPCRAPTRADYIRLGVSAEALDNMGLTA